MKRPAGLLDVQQSIPTIRSIIIVPESRGFFFFLTLQFVWVSSFRFCGRIVHFFYGEIRAFCSQEIGVFQCFQDYQ